MKYMGSKARIAKDICPIIQSFIDKSGAYVYIEGFVGGANIIDKINCDIRHGIDKNKYLIALLKYVANGGELLGRVSKDTYTEVKQNEDNYPNWLVGNVGFLASYNGKFFDGGYANTVIEHTKYGDKVRDYYQEGKRNLEQQAPNLKDIIFTSGDFLELWKSFVGQKEVVFYFDIPYLNTTKYDVSKGFDYDKFYDICRELSKNNIVIVSEQWMPDDFTCIWEKKVARTISATGREYPTEKLFVIGKALEYI